MVHKEGLMDPDVSMMGGKDVSMMEERDASMMEERDASMMVAKDASTMEVREAEEEVVVDLAVEAEEVDVVVNLIATVAAASDLKIREMAVVPTTGEAIRIK